MALDGLFTQKLTKELSCAADCHIDKLYQPSADELVFLLRKKGFTKRLLVSARQGAARVHFTAYATENPQTPPMFCMLARKYFSSAKIISVSQRGFERILEITFETTDELGDRVNPKIICEMIGNQSNIILVNGKGNIIDAVRRSDISLDKRMIQPGAKYVYPAAQEKADLNDNDAEDIAKSVLSDGEKPLAKSLTEHIGGISPLVAREIAFKLTGNTEALCSSAHLCDLSKLISEIKGFKTPFMLIKEDGSPADFSYMPIAQYQNCYAFREYPSFSELLDAFYHEREQAARIKKLSNDVTRLLNNLISRAHRRQAARKEELERSKNRETLRINGELIKANIHLIKPGAQSAVLTNFYDENMARITVPLDPALSAAKNAAKYFKDYKKSCVAAQTLIGLIESDENEIKYLNSVLFELSRCENSADIAEIKEELKSSGYIRAGKAAARKAKAPSLREEISQEGYRIIIGRNNAQNDFITLKLAAKNDLWFHAKDIHGSHVIVTCGGNPVCDETLTRAAMLAAENSKAADSSNVPVDYTYIKYVKKPSGAKPGMVIYTNNKTLYVTPGEKENL